MAAAFPVRGDRSYIAGQENQAVKNQLKTAVKIVAAIVIVAVASYFLAPVLSAKTLGVIFLGFTFGCASVLCKISSEKTPGAYAAMLACQNYLVN